MSGLTALMKFLADKVGKEEAVRLSRLPKQALLESIDPQQAAKSNHVYGLLGGDLRPGERVQLQRQWSRGDIPQQTAQELAAKYMSDADKELLLRIKADIITGESPQEALRRYDVFAPGTTLYRGIPRMAPNNLEKVSGLHAKDRPKKGAPPAKANVKNFAWASDNPDIGNTYSHSGGVVVPLELKERPNAIVDAGGKTWDTFFFDAQGKPNSYFDRGPEKQFYEAMRDKGVNGVGVTNVIDPGAGDLMGDFFPANNLLIKDPNIVEYLLSRERANFARGGLAQMKECSCRK